MTRIARIGEWWEHKFAPIFALFYATALLVEAPLMSLWPAIFCLLAALAPGAVYVSVLNDVTDRVDDARAGKTSRLAGVSRWTVGALIVLPLLAGGIFLYVWRGDTLLAAAYLGAWIAFSLYSLPPFRLKTRGLAGVLADAAGAHAFPSIVAVALVFHVLERPVEVAWVVATGAWAFAYGLRGILWHQILDSENDRKAQAQTFVLRHSARTAARLGEWLAFPAEVLALGLILAQLDAFWPLVGLAAYGALVALRWWLWAVDPVIVRPKPRYTILLDEYYGVFLPLGLLLTAVFAHPASLIVLLIHLVAFPRRLLVAASDMARLPWHFYLRSGRRT